MRRPNSDVAFSPAVKAVQEQFGSRPHFALAELNVEDDWDDKISPSLAGFLAARDTIFLATASAAGQPYVQHRGGPPGFLRILDPKTLSFDDYRGNRQYITVGNLSENPRAMLFVPDFQTRRRIKIWGTAEVRDPQTSARSGSLTDGKIPVEREIIFHVEAWDTNCPSHIVRRFSESDLLAATQGMRARIEELEAEIARLRSQQARSGSNG